MCEGLGQRAAGHGDLEDTVARYACVLAGDDIGPQRWRETVNTREGVEVCLLAPSHLDGG